MKVRKHTKSEPEYFVSIEDMPLVTAEILVDILGSISGNNQEMRTRIRELRENLKSAGVKCFNHVNNINGALTFLVK